MALGRVLVLFSLALGLRNARGLSLDLEGLKDRAVSQITGPQLMEIVSVLPALLACRSHDCVVVNTHRQFQSTCKGCMQNWENASSILPYLVVLSRAAAQLGFSCMIAV